MDVCESEQALRKHKPAETLRPPLVPAGRNDAVTSHSRTREVSSRYKSPSPSTPSGPWRSSSPTIPRTVPQSSQFVSKRAQSAERKRRPRPPSPPCPNPSTPILDISVDRQFSSRRTNGSRLLPESLWPSTLRSLNVSFQSDTISIPVSKKEKPISVALSDNRTLRPSSNVAHKPVEMSVSRKSTPERNRSPSKGKNASDTLENSKPVNGLNPRLLDQHRLPSRIGGKVCSNALSKNRPVMGTGVSSLMRITYGAINKPLQKATTDAVSLLSTDERYRARFEGKLVEDNIGQEHAAQRLASVSLADRIMLTNPAPQSRPPSPNKSSVLSSSVTRGVSPSRARPSTPPPRGVSPSRIRPNNCSLSSHSTSVLSFLADIKKGKVGKSYIEDAHQLRLLYNRYLQWQLANARAQAVLHTQKVTVERTLYNVWNTTQNLWESVIEKRISLQQLKLESKLISVLNDQMVYLDGWAVLESDHNSSLSDYVEDQEASTLRLPVTGGARADIDSLKAAIYSASYVMQTMGPSICTLLSRVEAINSLISELAMISAKGKYMLSECEALLASTAAMQVKEYSLSTHLIQETSIAR